MVLRSLARFFAPAKGAAYHSSLRDSRALQPSNLSEFLTDEPPPSYTPQDIHGVPPIGEILSASSTTLAYNNAELAVKPSKLAVERLRNFLLYTMTVDYDARVGDLYLSSADADLYMEICRYLFTLEESWQVVQPSLEQQHTVGAYLLHHVLAPARVLGIPTDLVIVAIHRFGQFQTTLGGYKGCITGLRNGFSIRMLAAKFYLDGKIVIPAVAPDTETCRSLLETLQKVQQEYFTFVNAPSFLTMAPVDYKREDTGSLRCGPINLEFYGLTDRSKRYFSSREQGSKGVPPSKVVHDALEELRKRRREEEKRVIAGKATPRKLDSEINIPDHEFDYRTRIGDCSDATNPDLWEPTCKRGGNPL